MRKVIIDQAVFEQFPDFKRGLVIVSDIDNAPQNQNIQALLNDAIERNIGKNAVEHDFVRAWDTAHSRFGSNPNKFPPSIKSLLKRIDKGGAVPFINSAVALFNYISIRYLIPCGGDDIDRVEGNIRLGLAKGDEAFIPLGGVEQENPKPGEVILFDDKTLNVLCRRWNWRNGDFTKITEGTKRLVINVDGIGPVPRSLVEEARDELARLLAEQCSARLTTSLLDKDNEEITLSF